jgi:hypothetical protein
MPESHGPRVAGPQASSLGVGISVATGVVAAGLAVPAAVALLVIEAVAPRTVPVWAPLLASTFVTVAFWTWISRRAGEPSTVFEIGVVYAGVVWLYSCFPLSGFLVNGLQYGPLNDARLYVAAPDPAEVGRVSWMYFAHLAGFAFAYAAARKPHVDLEPRRTGRVEGLVLFLVVAGAQLWTLIVGWRYRWDFVTNLDRYAAIARLPQLLAQITGHLDGIRLTAEIVLLVFLFQRWDHYRLLIFAWLSFTAVHTFVERQSRTELVLLGFASLILYDALVRRIRVRGAAVLACFGVLAFGVLGLRRMESDEVRRLSLVKRMFVANEFESVFATAVDLDRRVRADTLGSLPRGLRATDALAVVPQQLVPWQKTTPADWYVRTMYADAADEGLGLAFGTVAEAIVGWGTGEALARGVLLGLVLAWVDWTVQRLRVSSFWWFAFGVWLTVQIYHSFRNTTFSFVAATWYRFLPVVVVVVAVSWVVRAALRRRPDPLGV